MSDVTDKELEKRKKLILLVLGSVATWVVFTTVAYKTVGIFGAIFASFLFLGPAIVTIAWFALRR